jgi:hypothetical protein
MGTWNRAKGEDYFAAADNEDFLALHLPGDDKASAALHDGELGRILLSHGYRGDHGRGRLGEEGKASRGDWEP